MIKVAQVKRRRSVVKGNAEARARGTLLVLHLLAIFQRARLDPHLSRARAYPSASAARSSSRIAALAYPPAIRDTAAD
eukprot:1838974-Rhodomonas_salina.1